MDEMFAIHQERWGAAHEQRCQDQVIEEAGEVLQAIIKLRRGKPNAREQLEGEIVDLLFALDCLTRQMQMDNPGINYAFNKVARRVTEKLRNQTDDASRLRRVAAEPRGYEAVA